AERMRRRGLERAAEHDRSRWRERFTRVVEAVLDAPARVYREKVEIQPRQETRTVTTGPQTVLIPVRLVNRGTHAVVPEGPARLVLRSQVVDETTAGGEPAEAETFLPALLLPGQSMAAALPVSVPARPGVYQVYFRAVAAGGEEEPGISTQPTAGM